MQHTFVPETKHSPEICKKNQDPNSGQSGVIWWVLTKFNLCYDYGNQTLQGITI